jgi:hypothetical protein
MSQALRKRSSSHRVEVRAVRYIVQQTYPRTTKTSHSLAVCGHRIIVVSDVQIKLWTPLLLLRFLACGFRVLGGATMGFSHKALSK